MRTREIERIRGAITRGRDLAASILAGDEQPAPGVTRRRFRAVARRLRAAADAMQDQLDDELLTPRKKSP